MGHTLGHWQWRVGEWDQLAALAPYNAEGELCGDPILQAGIETNMSGEMLLCLQIKDEDAALIASAPALLAACEAVVNWWEREGMRMAGVSGAPECILGAVAAIAAAKG